MAMDDPILESQKPCPCCGRCPVCGCGPSITAFPYPESYPLPWYGPWPDRVLQMNPFPNTTVAPQTTCVDPLSEVGP